MFGLSASDMSFAQQPDLEVKWNTPIQVPSPIDSNSWFPDFAVDSRGRVHVVWNETKPAEEGGEIERVYYSVWDGQKWSPYNDILVPQADINRIVIAIDDRDTLHLVQGWLSLYHKQADADAAISAAAWTEPRPINTRRGTYYKDIAIYKDTIHVLYDDLSPGGDNVGSDMYYRKSTDRGQTWGVPVALFPDNKGGSSRPHIEVDKSGGLYAGWDEGWDRLSGLGKAEYSVFMYSPDGGDTWSKPTEVTYPTADTAQLTVAGDGRGGVMLVWRTASSNLIYYMWSTDYGNSWFPPGSIPGILAREWGNPFDAYDMAVDSNGHVHLLVVGDLSMERRQRGVASGVYHLEWDGRRWFEPQPVFEGAWYPSYPKLVISRGNQFDATWHLDEALWNSVKPSQIWYVHGQSNAPAVSPEPIPTLTPTPEPPTLTPVATLTPIPTFAPGVRQTPVPVGIAESIYTETDELALLIKSLIPATLVITIILISLRFFKRS